MDANKNADTGSPFSWRGLFPLIVVTAIFAAVDVLIPLAVWLAGWLGDVFGRTDLRSSSLLQALSVFAYESCFMQPLVAAVWLVFGSGDWRRRLPVALAISVLLPALVLFNRSEIPLYICWWFVGTGMANLLAYAMPLAAWRLWRGLVLVDARRNDSRPCPAPTSRFALRDILAATASVALAAAAARWSADLTNRPQWLLTVLPYAALCDAAWSLTYLMPLTWCAVGICSTRRALLSVTTLTAIFSAIYFVLRGSLFSRVGVGPLVACISGGMLTVPGALLVWRWLGYRLVGPPNGAGIKGPGDEHA